MVIRMANDDNFSQGDFDRFLKWLDPDREQAGIKYKEIHRRLIKLFIGRGCIVPEELADETITRVIKKVAEIADNYVGEPIAYFYGVARNVYLEHTKPRPFVPPPPPPDPPEELEKMSDCLDECMEKLPSDDRALILSYYQQDKQAKIDYRKRLADELGIGMNALRIKVYRIRMILQECVMECVSREATG
jgi:DNA-directed RNA polymerase specialized sigma24 family protein